MHELTLYGVYAHQALTLARAGGGVDATPMSFSGMASELLDGSHWNFA